MTLGQNDFSVIPLQIIKPKEITLTLDESLTQQGFYTVRDGEQTLAYMACNVQLSESNLTRWTIEALKKANPQVVIANTVKKALNDLKDSRAVQSFFKWFLILSIVFFIFEMLIIKYL